MKCFENDVYKVVAKSADDALVVVAEFTERSVDEVVEFGDGPFQEVDMDKELSLYPGSKTETKPNIMKVSDWVKKKGRGILSIFMTEEMEL